MMYIIQLDKRFDNYYFFDRESDSSDSEVEKISFREFTFLVVKVSA